MSDSATYRRCSIRAIAAVTLFLVVGCDAASADSPAPSALPPLVGAWRAQLQFKDGAFAPFKDLTFMYVFGSGGTLTESSNYDAAPPVPPAYGVWRARAADRYELKYEFFVTAPPKELHTLVTGGGWSPAGRGVFTERVQLSADRNSFESQIEYVQLDAKGAPVAGGGSARGHGVRIGF